MPRKWPDSTKAACMAELLQGASVRSVSRQFAIPKQTISDWRRQALDEFLPDLKKGIPKINTGPFNFKKPKPRNGQRENGGK